MADDPRGDAATAADNEPPPAQVSPSSIKSETKKKKPPANLVIPPPKPKLSKAERRALQEQQRAAKAAGASGGGGPNTAAPGGARANSSTPARTTSSSDPVAVTKSPQPKSSPDHTKQKSSAPEELSSAAVAPASHHQRSSPISIVSHLTPYQNVDQSKLFVTGATLSVQSSHSHLHHQSSTASSVTSTSSSSSSHHLHPAVIQLGYQYATGQIRGGNARCRAMLECFALILQEYVPPPSEVSNSGGEGKRRGGGGGNLPPLSSQGASSSHLDLRQVLDQQVLKPSFAFWIKCRPHSVSMGNAFTFLKAAVASLDRDWNWGEMKLELLDTLQAYQQERIELAQRAIADLVVGTSSSMTHSQSQTRLLSDKDVVLVYGHAEVVTLLLQQHAAASGASSTPRLSRVIVVDSRPLFEGRQTLEALRQAGITCSYILLNALPYVLQDVTKVLLGASALMSDGSVLGRAGSASIALLAQSKHIPVLVCAETYKISNRVQLEGITTNELGDPQYLPGGMTNDKEDDGDASLPNLKPLHLMYDLTPASFVTGIVTELGIVPPTSVAVLLREMNPHEVKT